MITWLCDDYMTMWWLHDYAIITWLYDDYMTMWWLHDYVIITWLYDDYMTTCIWWLQDNVLLHGYMMITWLYDNYMNYITTISLFVIQASFKERQWLKFRFHLTGTIPDWRSILHLVYRFSNELSPLVSFQNTGEVPLHICGNLSTSVHLAHSKIAMIFSSSAK